MTSVDRAAFARGVNDAIRALRNVYGGVNSMFVELAAALEQDPRPLLFDFGVRAISTNKKDSDEKILRSWMGRFYIAEPTDEDAEEDSDEEETDFAPTKAKLVFLTRGQSLAFVKIVLYDPRSEEGEPRLLYGVLRDCQVGIGEGITFPVPKWQLKRVLDPVMDASIGQILTFATMRVPRGSGSRGKRKGSNRLSFRLDQTPRSRPLFDLRGPDQIQEVAADLKALWG